VVQPPSETSPLLSGGQSTSDDDDEVIDQRWEQAVAEGRIRTTWQRESKTLAQYSGPLVITFFLQYSINVASIFAVGRIGKAELGAVSGKAFPPPPFHAIS
jgi:MATE family multidrug resistance protein